VVGRRKAAEQWRQQVNIHTNLGTVTVGGDGWLSSSGATWSGNQSGFFLGWDSGDYRFRIGDSSQGIWWYGSHLDVYAGNVAIDGGGVRIPHGSNTSGSRILFGDTAVHSPQAGVLQVQGLLIPTSFSTQGTCDVEGAAGFGAAFNLWNPGTTSSSTAPPLVRETSGAIKVKTNVVTDTVTLSSASQLQFENGLLVNFS
jgi:hypothetical protein